MTREWVFLCPGQGSQTVGMGRALYEAFPHARRRFDDADAILGVPLKEIVFSGPEEALKETRNTQPALFTLDVVCAELAMAHGLVPVATAGHSLGEYAACVVAGALSFEDGLRLTRLRGELMYQAGLARPGAMAAVLGLAGDAVEEVLGALEGIVRAANLNTPTQVVISGEVDAVERAIPKLIEAGARKAVRLPVSGAFHSPLMEPAAEGLAEALLRTALREASVPVVTNVDAKPVRQPEALRRALIDQLTAKVRWSETMEWFRREGHTKFLETGPGKVLQGMAKQIDRSLELSGIDSPETLAALRSVSPEAPGSLAVEP